MDQGLPTMPEDFPDDSAGGEQQSPERTPSRYRGHLLIPALVLGMVGVVYAAWELLPLFIEEGDRSTIPVFVIYLIAGFAVGAILGLVVGATTAFGVYFVREVRPGARAELVGVALVAGSATAVVLYLFLQYAGISDLTWLHVALTVVIPAALCRYTAR